VDSRSSTGVHDVITDALRAAVAEARRLLTYHPQLTNISEATDAAPGIAITVDVHTNLPFAWMADGMSPKGVRAVERVRVYFPSTFPLYAPSFSLREDFDRTLAHLLPGSNDAPPAPCIFEGNATELFHHAGLHALIDHLVEWLEDAAMERLIDPAQGWEPIRRDTVTHTITLDADFVRSLVTKTAGYTLLRFTYFRSPTAMYGEVHNERSALHINGDPNEYFGETTTAPMRGKSVALVVWPGKHPNGAPFIDSQFQAETVTTLGTLRSRAANYGAAISLRDALRFLERCFGKHYGSGRRVAIILCARRPMHLIGSESAIELSTYLTEVSAPALFPGGDTTSVLPAAQHHAITPQLLRRMSGDAPEREASRLMLLGCGSLGSKIAIHLARRGIAPSDVVDNKYLQPHNAARHALIPTAESHLPWLGHKADLLAEAVRGFRQQCTPHHDDIVVATRTKHTIAKLIRPDVSALLNTTAAAAVGEALAALPSEAQVPRIMDAALLAAGTIGVLAVEGPSHNPNIGDLTNETYALLRNHRLAATIFAAHAEAIEVGQGCASLTTPMSDAQISLFAAAMSESIAMYEAQMPATGTVLVGTRENLNLTWATHIVPPVQVVPIRAQQACVRLSDRAHRAIVEDVSRHPGSETGGVLLGRYAAANRTFYVTDILLAPPDSTRAAALFILGTAGLSVAIDDYARPTHFALYALGTWHSHLRPEGASLTDRETARVIANSKALPAVLLIHTPDGYQAILVD
jgi:hypothetical protein